MDLQANSHTPINYFRNRIMNGCESLALIMFIILELLPLLFIKVFIMKNKKEIFDYLLNKGYIIKSDEVFSFTGRKLSLYKVGKGKHKYYKFNITYKGKRKRIFIHQIVAYLKYGDKIFENKILVRHLDGNSLNNKSINIAIGTALDNIMDIPKIVRFKKAVKASYVNRRFTNEDVLQILNDRKNGMTYKELCEKYKTSKSTLSYFFNKALYVKNGRVAQMVRQLSVKQCV